MAKREALEKFLTPTGVAVYPHLTKPDFGNSKFPKPKGEFSVKLRLSAEDAQPLVERIDELANLKFEAVKESLLTDADPKTKAKSKVKAKKLERAPKPYKLSVDDEGDETGEVEFNVKMNHIITKQDGTTFKLYPKLFDTSNPPQKLDDDIQVWAGSQLKVSGEYSTYDSPMVGVGVSLRLGAVQVIELVSGFSKSAEDYGFGGEEGGYVKEEAEDEEVDNNKELTEADGDAAAGPDEF